LQGLVSSYQNMSEENWFICQYWAFISSSTVSF